MLEVRRLRLLRDLSIYGTVAATAEAAHLTGPAVSQQLAALEKEAGLPLVEKDGRRLRLTAAGRLLVGHADVVLGGLAAAEADLAALRGGGRGLVRITAFPSAARVLLPRVWRLLAQADGQVPDQAAEREADRATNRATGTAERATGQATDRATAAPESQPARAIGPATSATESQTAQAADQAVVHQADQAADLRITEREPGSAINALRHGEADIAVVHAYSLLPRDLPPGCEQHRLLEEPVLLVLPLALAARYGLSRKQGTDTAPADLARFADENWLMPGADTSCHELIKRACAAAGFLPRPVVLASDFSVITALVAAGAGVALVPRMALPADTRGISVHTITQPVTRTVSALTRVGDARQPRLSRVLECLLTVSADSVFSVDAPADFPADVCVDFPADLSADPVAC